jgi:4-alpha-glucanotransferase
MQRSSKISALPPGRQAGVCLHLTSLPGAYGIGDIGQSALQFVDSLASMNLGIWQFLPTGPTAYGDSPYQPLSVFAGNDLLIDVESLIHMGLLKPDDPAPLRKLPRHLVDYGKVIPLKAGLLAYAIDRFASHADSALKSGFDQFLDENESVWLHDYALFRVLKSRHGNDPWPKWDRPFAQRQSAAIKKLENDARAQITAVKMLQFLFRHQWKALHAYASEKGVRLFGDMPIYLALDSADAWAHPENLRIDRRGRPKYVAGVPPDYFSKNGQLWGNPLHDWDYQASNGFSWWVARMRHSLSRVDLVRLDHFRGFESFWSVPVRAKTARKGQWEPGPGAALFDALHQALGDLPIVAEDLGAITQKVDALRERYKIPGMKVLQFEVMKVDFDIADIDENCVCYTGTHDNDTTLGWFGHGLARSRGKKAIAKAQKTVLELTGGRPETIHHDLIRLACASKARVAIAPMQDFLGLGSEARLNTPGTAGNNWRWRLLPEQLTPDFRDSVRRLTER